MGKASAAIFGGAGFIGSHLLRYLRQQGIYERLYCIDIAEPRFLVQDVDYVKHDVRFPVPPELVGAGELEVFNLAAVHTTPGHQDWEYYWTNVLGATNICEFATKRSVKQLFFTSSIAVYGPSEDPKDEDCPLEPVGAYGRSKLQAERIHSVWQQERSNERHLTIVRPAVIYGFTERGNFTRLSKMLARGRFFYPGRTDTIKACGYVKDLVKSMIFAAQRREGTTVYNFAYPRRTTSSEICEAFCDSAGYARPKLVIPISIMLFAAVCFELIGKLGLRTDINRERVRKLMNSTNIIPKRLQEWGYNYDFDLHSSLDDWKSESVQVEVSGYT